MPGRPLVPSYDAGRGARGTRWSLAGVRHRPARPRAPASAPATSRRRPRTPRWSPRSSPRSRARRPVARRRPPTAVPSLAARLAPVCAGPRGAPRRPRRRRPEAERPTAGARVRCPAGAPPALAAVRRSEQRLLRDGCATAASPPRAATSPACWPASPRPRRPARRRPGRGGRRRMTALDALQTTLAAEHAALYVYGVLGGADLAVGDPALFDALHAGYRRAPRAARPAAAAGRRGRRRAGGRRGGVRAGRPARCAAPRSQAAALAHRGAARRRTPRWSRRSSGAGARVGPHRGDVVGGVAARAGRRPADLAGRARAGLTASCAAGNGKRSAASAFGEVPRSLPKAEDADRIVGLVSITLCELRLWGGGATCTIMHAIRGCGSASDLHVRASHKVAANLRESAQASDQARTTSGISASDVHAPRPARPRCGRPARPGWC